MLCVGKIKFDETQTHKPTANLTLMTAPTNLPQAAMRQNQNHWILPHRRMRFCFRCQMSKIISNNVYLYEETMKYHNNSLKT